MNLEDRKNKIVNIGISNRHAHLTEDTIMELFGKDRLEIMKELSQPWQFAAKETVDLVWPAKISWDLDSRVILKWVRILWPARLENQIELSLTDSRQLWIKNVPIRLSWVLSETPWIIIRWSKWEVKLERWVIVSQKHIHIEPRRAMQRWIKDNDIISVWVESWVRSWIMTNIIVRLSNSAWLDVHVDTDEWNAFGLWNNAKWLVLLSDEEILNFIKNNAK